MTIEKGLKNPNQQLSKKEDDYLDWLKRYAREDAGAIEVHPHNPNEWGRYLVFKSLVRKGLAVIEYNDGVCPNGWIAEFYDKDYYEEVF